MPTDTPALRPPEKYAQQRLARWRDFGDVSMTYCAGDKAFGDDVRTVLTDLATARAEIERLRTALIEFHWMARRYCDGRMSTAPHSFNALVRSLLEAGIPLREPRFARDGMGRQYDGLSEDEAQAAQADMPKGHAALEAEWLSRTETLRTALTACVDALDAMMAGSKHGATTMPDGFELEACWHTIRMPDEAALDKARAARGAGKRAMEGKTEKGDG